MELSVFGLCSPARSFIFILEHASKDSGTRAGIHSGSGADPLAGHAALVSVKGPPLDRI